MDLNSLCELFPFQNLDEETLNKIKNDIVFECQCYQKNDVILSKEQFDEKVGFVLSGECAVYRERIKEAILLQTLRKNDSFGILTLFTKEEYPTVIVAKRSTKVLFIDKNTFLDLIFKYNKVSMNVIAFMAKKISFLNQKIATLSGATVEEKVECYLYSQMQIYGTEFNLNIKRVSEQINIGRASLYRALDCLTESGVVEVVDKKIYIRCPEALERTKK